MDKQALEASIWTVLEGRWDLYPGFLAPIPKNLQYLVKKRRTCTTYEKGLGRRKYMSEEAGPNNLLP